MSKFAPCLLLLLFSFTPVQAKSINPAVVAIKDWLLQKGPDGFDNGMRKSLTFHSPAHRLEDAKVSYSVLQSSAVARTLKFLSEYYLTYQADLSAAEKDDLYEKIQLYAAKLLLHRRYANGWGWEITDHRNENLEADKFYRGAFVTSQEHKMFTGLGNAFAGEALAAATKVADARGDRINRDGWFAAARKVGEFLIRLANPYFYYKEKFRVDCMVDETGSPVHSPGLVYSMVSSQENLATEVPLQNLYAIVALQAIGEIEPTNSIWKESARQIRDAMLPGLHGFNAAFFVKFDDRGTGKLLPNEYQDNAWHPLKSGQVGDDNIEYALAALYQYGHTEDLAKITWPFLKAPAIKLPNYDPFITFTGYFKNFGGVWKHQMPYYDMVGFGLLGELRRSLSLADYQRAFTAVVENKIKAGRPSDLTFTMLDHDLNPYWASTDEASQSTLGSVAIGLSLMRISPYFKGSETFAPAGGAN